MRMYSIVYVPGDADRTERFEIDEFQAPAGASARISPADVFDGWNPAVAFLVSRGAGSTLAHRAVAQAILRDRAYVVV